MSSDGAQRDVPGIVNPSFDLLRARYRDFAEHEARGRSPRYVELAYAVPDSEGLLGFISSLPADKQQPNLVFAAVRHLYGTPRSAQHFADLVASHPDPIRALILRRSTQTNEPGRCASLLPALGLLPEPLALLEVGASAGLCLLPDCYGYDYGAVQLRPSHDSIPAAPVFPCRVDAATPLPSRLPQVAWRAGLDLNPIDLHDPEQTAWLETLVWPGQEARAERLRGAMAVARARAPLVLRGDLLKNLPDLAEKAPEGATLVIFHSAVLPYLAAEDSQRFVSLVRELDAVWISNESPDLLSEVAGKVNEPVPSDQFLLSMNGEPLAVTDPHGQSIRWLRESSA
jgi:hypothetical protein